MEQESLLINEDVERGGNSAGDSYGTKHTVANAEVHVRLAFLRKVYSLLAIQLGLTVIITSVLRFVPLLQFYIRYSDWMLTVAFLVNIGLLIALHIKRKQHPTNLFLLIAFTIGQAYMIGVVVSYYDQIAVLQAFLLTFVIVLGLSLYALQTTKDYTTMGSGLFAGLIVLIIGGFLQMFIGGSAFDFLISAGGALLFSLFIIFDTQMILQKVSPEEYILATISLYLDIINLFLYILRLFDGRRQ